MNKYSIENYTSSIEKKNGNVNISAKLLLFIDEFRFYGMDYFINFIMTTQGDVGLIKTPNYQFNVHENNSNYKAFQPEQTECFFNEFRLVITF